MAQLVKVIATSNTIKYAFLAPAGLYNGDIATQSGIAVAVETDQDLPAFTVKQLLKKGIIRRVSAVTKTVDGKPSRLKLLCVKEKVATILDALDGKSYTIVGGKGGTITSVGFSLRVVSRG